MIAVPQYRIASYSLGFQSHHVPNNLLVPSDGLEPNYTKSVLSDLVFKDITVDFSYSFTFGIGFDLIAASQLVGS